MNLQRFFSALVTIAMLTPAVCLAVELTPKKMPVAASKALSDPVARVNGVPIAAADFAKAYKALSAAQGGAQVPPGKEQEAQQFVLNQLISAELMYQLGQKTPVADMDKKVDETITRLKGRFKTEDEFRKGLDQQGLNEKELRELIRRNVVIENHIEQTIASKIKVTEQEIREFYDKNPETFTMPEQVRASHILITVDSKASADDKQKARAKADELLKQVKAGADFAKLAKDNSGCPSNKQGGDLGYFSKGQMVKPFEDAAWAMKPGEVSGVVETQFGYHIIKVTEKRAKDKMPFDALKGRIETSLKQRKIGEQVNAALDTAKKAAKIEMYLK
ncbi:MAG: peptidylprolyl isomerase [Trichlorobacter sp.]|jgi:peptidyl-prolyl cis-trans isomerase C